MSDTSMIDWVLTAHGIGIMLTGAQRDGLRTEIRALIAERDRLQQTADGYHDAWEAADRALAALKAAKAPARPAPARTLRQVKFSDGLLHRWNNGQLEWKGSHSGIWNARSSVYVPDTAEVEALKADPYEPVETVEDVLREMCMQSDSASSFVDRLRAAVAAEGGAA